MKCLLACAVLVLLPVRGALQQYTPNQADWSTYQSKAVTNSSTNTAHDPDSVGWITTADWKDSEWDGYSYNPSKMTDNEFWEAMCPSVDRIRGIREVFYAANPFADNENPTKAEVDDWHRIAINHVRALIGYTAPERLVEKDHCMFLRSLWGQQRKKTTMWDAAYPAEEEGKDTVYGPCQTSTLSHCGATFIPSDDDQQAYLEPLGLTANCSTAAGSEGIFSASKANIPWSLKWSRSFCNTLKSEGFWGGHMGPFFRRQKFGFSFWDSDVDSDSSIAILRGKWTGSLLPHLYCNPSDADCDPNAAIDYGNTTVKENTTFLATTSGSSSVSSMIGMVMCVLTVVGTIKF